MGDLRQDELSVDRDDSGRALSVRFLVEADDSNGSASVFEWLKTPIATLPVARY
jgi:hypothetical protein